jgi:crotonobetainyl-CoA:carnitine CoA-transferase CaiB-like acyl-CoA transferase
MRPLEGVRILTIEHFGAGPYGTMFLAGLGAQVTKIEKAASGGDPGRHVGPHRLGEDDSQYFQSWNLNKRSVSLDLESQRDAFERLVSDADALVNNLRGELPARLGLDYRSLSRVNPALVCLHISAYGRDNERASWPGYDFLMQAEAGLMSLTGEPGGPPSRFGTSIIDCMTGMTGVAGLLACLLQAKRTGRGCDVDVSLFDVALHQLGYMGTWFLNGGEPSSRQPRSAHYSLAPVQTFPTADGWIFVACMTERFWLALIDALSRRELGEDARFATQAARLEHREALTGLLDAEFRRRSTAHWLAALSGLLPVAPINDLRQALENPFVAATGMVRPAPHPARPDLRVLATPVKIDGERPLPAVCEPLKR